MQVRPRGFRVGEYGMDVPDGNGVFDGADSGPGQRFVHRGEFPDHRTSGLNGDGAVDGVGLAPFLKPCGPCE